MEMELDSACLAFRSLFSFEPGNLLEVCWARKGRFAPPASPFSLLRRTFAGRIDRESLSPLLRPCCSVPDARSPLLRLDTPTHPLGKPVSRARLSARTANQRGQLAKRASEPNGRAIGRDSPIGRD